MQEGIPTKDNVKEVDDEKLISYFTECITNIVSTEESEWGFTGIQQKRVKMYKSDFKVFRNEILRRIKEVD